MEELQAKIVELEKELDQRADKMREYELFLSAIDSQEYPLYLASCAEEGCKGIEVSDGGRGINVVDGCQKMIKCDECFEVSYCDAHQNKFNIIPLDETEIYYCNGCFLKERQKNEENVVEVEK